jgi:hypothetical protein
MIMIMGIVLVIVFEALCFLGHGTVWIIMIKTAGLRPPPHKGRTAEGRPERSLCSSCLTSMFPTCCSLLLAAT